MKLLASSRSDALFLCCRAVQFLHRCVCAEGCLHKPRGLKHQQRAAGGRDNSRGTGSVQEPCQSRECPSEAARAYALWLTIGLWSSLTIGLWSSLAIGLWSSFAIVLQIFMTLTYIWQKARSIPEYYSINDLQFLPKF